MTICTKWVSFTAALSFAAAVASCTMPAQVSAGAPHDQMPTHSHVAFSHALPRLDGAHLQVKVIEVTYGPGESSPPHSHPCAVVGYVAEGLLRTQVKGEPEAIYKAGDTFYEAPNGIHLVSGNGSDKQRAKLIAYFVCDHDTPLTVPVAETRDAKGNHRAAQQ
jgi:quercetin dioxygenase-like cupin family protein